MLQWRKGQLELGTSGKSKSGFGGWLAVRRNKFDVG